MLKTTLSKDICGNGLKSPFKNYDQIPNPSKFMIESEYQSNQLSINFLFKKQISIYNLN